MGKHAVIYVGRHATDYIELLTYPSPQIIRPWFGPPIQALWEVPTRPLQHYA